MNMRMIKRVKRAKAEGRLYSSVAQRLNPWRFLRPALSYYVPYERNSLWRLGNLKRGIAGHVLESSASKEQITRIIDSYKLMKEAQKLASKVYLPSEHWQIYITNFFRDIESAIRNNEHKLIAGFLMNFLRNRSYGISLESSMRFRFQTQKLAYIAALKEMYSFWKFCNPESSIEKLAMPLVGNPRGYYINGHFVNTASFFNGSRVFGLTPLLSGVQRPVVAEIGGGYGPTAYFFLNSIENMTYMDFDLPETLIFIFYFLSSVFPKKKFLLYGEREFDEACAGLYDIILMPNFEIEKLTENSVDLFINEASFGEMNKSTVENYISHISRCCRGYFSHLNHEYFADTHSDDPGLKAKDYPVREEDFILVYRAPDMAHFLFQRAIFGRPDMGEEFSYLYQKRK